MRSHESDLTFLRITLGGVVIVMGFFTHPQFKHLL